MERATRVVSKGSWHYKVYNSWVARKRYREKSRDNLCHYMRVVLIYSPIEAFFYWFFGKNLSSGKLRFPVYPWTVYLSFIFLFLVYLWPLTVLATAAGAVLWFGLGVLSMVGIVELICLIHDDDMYDREDALERMKAVAGILIFFMPIGLIVCGIFYLKYLAKLRRRGSPQRTVEKKEGDSF